MTDTATDALAETRVTPWVPFNEHGLTAYRIWFRKTDFGIHQIHEWKLEGGGVRLDHSGWIKSGSEFPPTAVKADWRDAE